MRKEKFKVIREFKNYSVGNSGSVKSNATNKHLKAHCNARGYLKIQLSNNGKRQNKYIHLLVLEAFKGKRPKGAHGCHNNHSPKDNRIENLRWDTPENNYKEKRTVDRGEQVYTAKLTVKRIKEVRRLSKIGVSNRQIAKIFDVTHSTVGNILNGVRWAHVK